MSKKGKAAKGDEGATGARKPNAGVGKGSREAGKRAEAPSKAMVETGKAGRQAAVAASAAVERVSKDRDGMTEEQILQISRAIADPRRMGMLRAIAQKTATCDGMRQCAGVSAATLSHHMKQLEAAGLIETKKDGRFLRAALQKKVWKGYVSALKAIGS